MAILNRCAHWIFFLSLSFCLQAEQPFITARLWGRLGNHLFIIAATTSLALDNDAIPVFHDLVKEFEPKSLKNSNYVIGNLHANYTHLFYKLNTSNHDSQIECVYREPFFAYSPIHFRPNMLLEGWFQSEKYFAHHKNEILDLFAPSETIIEYLTNKYLHIIENPRTVSVHLRCYTKENPKLDIVYPTYGREYFMKAMQYFHPDSQFVVFSDDCQWAKEQLANIAGNILFIEGEEYYHDFYLMSLCKHNIICNSTFSWWAAYLNKNPEKIVIVPNLWFKPEYNHNTKDLIPGDWTMID